MRMNKALRFIFVVCLITLSSQSLAQNVLVPVNAKWRYYDSAIAPANNWHHPLFDDSKWPLGKAQLGFGEGDEQTRLAKTSAGTPIIAYYFRHEFNWNGPNVPTKLNLRMLVDDGARVFINGIEVHRLLLPNGTQSGQPRLTSNNSDVHFATGSLIEYMWYEVTLNKKVTLQQNNVVAVEVRQISQHSSDVSFNLELLLN